MNQDLERLAAYADQADDIARTATAQAVRAAAHLVSATVRSVYPTAQYLRFYEDRDTAAMVDRISDAQDDELGGLPEEVTEWEPFENAVSLLGQDSNISGWSSDTPFDPYPSLGDFRLNIDDFIPKEDTNGR